MSQRQCSLNTPDSENRRTTVWVIARSRHQRLSSSNLSSFSNYPRSPTVLARDIGALTILSDAATPTNYGFAGVTET